MFSVEKVEMGLRPFYLELHKIHIEPLKILGLSPPWSLAAKPYQAHFQVLSVPTQWFLPASLFIHQLHEHL